MSLSIRQLLHPALRRGSRREGGSTSLQMVIVMPAALLMFFVAMQGALYYHAGAIASAAAREGARAAATENATAGAGSAAATSYVNDTSRDELTGTSVSADRGPEFVTVTVTGQSLSVIPGFNPTVRKSATLAVERITQ